MLRDTAILVSVSQRRTERRMLTFLCRAHGRVRLFYRRFPARVRQEYLSPLQEGELVFVPPEERVPGRMISFACERIREPIRQEFERLVCGLHFADMAAGVVGEGEPAPDIYGLLGTFLDVLAGGAEPEELRIVFDLKILQACGLALQLDRCVSCRGEVERQGAAFSSGEGGVLCERCRERTAGVIRRLSGGALSFLRRVQTISPSSAGRLRIGTEMRREVLPLVEEFAEFHLERQAPSVGFLRAVRNKGLF